MSKTKADKQSRRAARKARAQERAEFARVARENGIKPLAAWLRLLATRMLSSLRFSLTLRIALHYAAQLIRTAFFAWFVFTLAFGAAQIPTVTKTLDALEAAPPAQAERYSPQQLQGLPVSEAYRLAQSYPDDLSGFFQRVKLSVGGLFASRFAQLPLSRPTVAGELVAAFSLEYVGFLYSVLLCALLGLELYRMLYFLRKRYRLNRRVLKPISDITEAAEALSASNLSDRINIEGTKNELKDLAAVINGMLDRIERSYNSQKQFVSDASHELRTPIAVIQGYASMLERWGKTDKAVLDEGIAAISQETTSMKELVERLLFLARHDKKTLMLEMERFDPAEIMSAVHRDAKLLSSAHQFALEPLQHAMIVGDKGMLKQLMRILVDNAIKYTPAGGRITLGLVNDGQQSILSVRDTGAGISAEELPRIFDRFYRSDQARRAQTGGHGLGLSIARIIVIAHGGKLKVRSKEGSGTTFSVILPLADTEGAPAIGAKEG